MTSEAISNRVLLAEPKRHVNHGRFTRRKTFCRQTDNSAQNGYRFGAALHNLKQSAYGRERRPLNVTHLDGFQG
jgi:hypothetical protein